MTTDAALDFKGVMQRLENDEELFREIVAIFDSTRDASVKAISDALAKNDAEAMGKAAHTIKGALGNIGANRAQAVAFQLESMGKATDLSKAPQLLVQLNKAIDDFQSAYRDYVAKA